MVQGRHRLSVKIPKMNFYNFVKTRSKTLDNLQNLWHNSVVV